LPKKISTKTDKWNTGELLVAKNTVDGDVGDLAAPDAVKSSPLPPPPPGVVVTAEPVGKGIWYMGGTGEHSVLFEFADHLLLFETPISDARTLAVIAKARETVPGKPLTMAVTSHHHFDHAGGFRAAVSEGLTMLMYKDNVALFKDVATRPHTINPDALAKSPRVFKFQAVDDKLTLKDATMEVVLYHVKGDVHADTELMAWVPRDRILVEADQYDRTWLQHPWGENFLKNVEQRNLKVDRILAIHGTGPEPWSEVVQTIKAKGSAPAATN
jgi:glyoxylase-like metal-dependent hydrolase (beta-lactamase superfamily II)